MAGRPVTKEIPVRHVSIVMDLEMKHLLQRMAEADHRTLSQYLRLIVVEHLKSKGVEFNSSVLI